MEDAITGHVCAKLLRVKPAGMFAFFDLFSIASSSSHCPSGAHKYFTHTIAIYESRRDLAQHSGAMLNYCSHHEIFVHPLLVVLSECIQTRTSPSFRGIPYIAIKISLDLQKEVVQQ